MNNRDINVELKDEIININLPFADRGLPGKSAYELAVEAGFIGTEEEWRASLKGDTGETPNIEIGTVVTGSSSSVTRRGTDENPIFDFVLEKGDTGPQGETGATGPQGQTGLTPNIQIGTVSSGDAPAVTRTGSDEEPIFNFVLEKGPKPVKGVDYYTEQDKEEIIDDVTGDALSIFNQNAAQKTDNFNYNATSKTTEFNTNANTKTNEFNTNASNKLSAYNTNASDKLDIYNDNHTSKLTAYNENASTKLTEFNTNATTKTTDFNDNASLKITEFNTNAQNKTDEFNENKEALQKELDEVQEELDRYKMLENALPKVTGEGTSVTLNNTANAPMKMSLGANTEQESTTQNANLCPPPTDSHWELTGGAYVNGNGYLVFPNVTSKATIKIAWDYKYDSLLIGFYAMQGNACYLNVLYYDENNQQLGTNGAQIPLPNTNRYNTRFGGSAPYSEYIKNSKYIILTFSRNSTYAPEEFAIKDIVFYKDSASQNTYIPFVPDSPSPDYPQEVHTISGDNEIVVGNKNLWNKDDESALNGYYNTDGSFYSTSGSINQYRVIAFNCSEGDKFIKSGNGWGGIVTFWNNDTFVSSINSTTATIPSGVNNVRFACLYSSTNAQLEKNVNTATSYEPHQEQTLPLNLGNLEYCKIDDYEDEFVIPDSEKNKLKGALDGIKSRNTNGTWNDNVYTYNGVTFTVNSDLSITIGGTFNSRAYLFISDNKFDVEQTSYILNGCPSGGSISIYDIACDIYSDNETRTTVTDIGNSIEINTTSKINPKLDLYIDIKSSAGIGKTFYPMLRLSSITDDTYEPYNPESKWYLKKNIGKVVLDGSETWENYNGGHAEGFYVYFRPFTSFKLGFQTTKCTHFNNVSASWMTDLNKNGRYSDHQSLAYRYFVTNEYDTNTKFKEFVANKYQNNTPITLYGKLATPAYVLLNDTLQTQLNNIRDKVLAYQGQTNISQVNNDLPFRLKLSTIRDMSNIFELIGTNSSTSSTLSTLSSPLSTSNLISPTTLESDISTTDVVDNTSEI